MYLVLVFFRFAALAVGCSRTAAAAAAAAVVGGVVVVLN